MSEQNKSARPSSPKEPKDAGGVDDIEESEEGLGGEKERIEQDDAREAGGNRRAEREEPGSFSDSSDGR
jgi:hypothetical protein